MVILVSENDFQRIFEVEDKIGGRRERLNSYS